MERNSDQATYTCVAKNAEGYSARGALEVQVMGKLRIEQLNNVYVHPPLKKAHKKKSMATAYFQCLVHFCLWKQQIFLPSADISAGSRYKTGFQVVQK